MTSERKCSKAGCGAQEIIGKPCTDFDCPQQWVHHTRAVPDVPELERYGKEYNGGLSWDIIKKENGKYVLYSQAAEIIAAKDKEIERLKEALSEIANAYTAHGYSDAMDAVHNLKDVAKDAINGD